MTKVIEDVQVLYGPDIEMIESRIKELSQEGYELAGAVVPTVRPQLEYTETAYMGRPTGNSELVFCVTMVKYGREER